MNTVSVKNQALFELLRANRHSKFANQRPNIKLIAQKLSIANESSPSGKKKHEKINHPNEFTIDMCKQLIGRKLRKKTVQVYQPKLTDEEKRLFDEEELLSPYQDVIANACGRRQQKKQVQSRPSAKSNSLPIHQFCRIGVYPDTSISRQQMEDDQVPWTVDLPNYNPPYYTHSSLLYVSTDTDPEEIDSTFMWNTFDINHNIDRRTANPTGRYEIDQKGYPLNPLGRTGIRGRGILPHWGVNYQTHLVIMCGTNETKFDKEVFKYMMHTTVNDSYYHLPATWTTGTNMNAVKKTLKSFLGDIYHKWNSSDSNVNDDATNGIIDHLTFVSTAYIGKENFILSFSNQMKLLFFAQTMRKIRTMLGLKHLCAVTFKPIETKVLHPILPSILINSFLTHLYTTKHLTHGKK
ncbi:unnamed protein product [Adineta ricciae]|uniref:Uncharacterized protein n=1 Tax=Adineta ricciae TaxID=249248 RepID=A0A815PMB1_ADIRI|nr:unnamed protein product [Adineta ricciae]